MSDKEKLANITREYKKLLNMLAKRFPEVYEYYKSGLKPRDDE